MSRGAAGAKKKKAQKNHVQRDDRTRGTGKTYKIDEKTAM